MNGTLDEIVRIFEERGGQEYYGEVVTQLQHALQAAHAAVQAGADEEMILAALLHDIGHMLDGVSLPGIGVVDHDRAAAEWLRSRGFSERLVQLAGGHVAAKRYLVSANPAYHARLSPTSQRTLELQGGPMSEHEAQQFRSHPLFEEILRLRVWDEAAKDPAASPAGLDSYLPAIERHLRVPKATLDLVEHPPDLR
jgi:phosphonate degradation associated HDIG domain protein